MEGIEIDEERDPGLYDTWPGKAGAWFRAIRQSGEKRLRGYKLRLGG